MCMILYQLDCMLLYFHNMYIKANNPFLLSSVMMQLWRIDLFRSNYSASGD